MSLKHVLSQNGIQAIPLKSCTTMYLYDNSIPQIEGLTNVHSLKDLYLQVKKHAVQGLGLPQCARDSSADCMLFVLFGEAKKRQRERERERESPAALRVFTPSLCHRATTLRR